MSDNKHVDAEQKSAWSGKKKWLVFGGAPVALVATTGAAAAIFFALAGVSGTGTNGDFSAKFSSGQPSVMDTSTLVVKPMGDATVASNKLVIPDMTMYPTESFTVQSPIVTGSASQTGYVSGVQLPGLPAGYTATLIDGCAARVSPSMTYVTIKIEAPAVQTAGATWALSADAGVKVTPGATPAGFTCDPYVAP